MRRSTAFTLAELLIALGILGVIGTFTIPKVLQAQQDGRNKAKVKEIAAALSQAYQSYRVTNQVTASTKLADLIPYLNYAKDPYAPGGSGTPYSIDGFPGDATSAYYCAWAGMHCLVFTNGAIAFFPDSRAFGGTGSTNAVTWLLDADGQLSTTKSIIIYVYIDGKIRTGATREAGTMVGGGAPPAFPDPSWFSWD